MPAPIPVLNIAPIMLHELTINATSKVKNADKIANNLMIEIFSIGNFKPIINLTHCDLIMYLIKDCITKVSTLIPSSIT